ncbi:hypothetical protein [Marinobacter sp. X15-166B]|uniref:hypothetical protein n=1 Tax=Marinobacter sp. X15-166B TaxID=1897620 RepID=UPI00085BCB75|nr:hypothetical protein [Marinobacter sp. X15-166B]OEY67445.1 hypothetical protein BG841_14060 [Marinobacter sp. X15-166B]
MTDADYKQYTPPRTVREHKFSVRLSSEDHIRLLWWARNGGTDATRRRAAAARYAIQQFLEQAGVPSAEEIIKASRKPGPRRRAIDRFLDEAGIPDAEEIRRKYDYRPL